MRAFSLLLFVIPAIIHPSHIEIKVEQPVYDMAVPFGTNLKTDDQLLLDQQMRNHPNLPPIDFWLSVAQCETAQNWDQGKNWKVSYVSGGLGIANVTWVGYGGKHFASKAARASKWAQIYIANKIAFIGHLTNGYATWEDRVNGNLLYRQPVGFGQGWGGNCRKGWIREHGTRDLKRWERNKGHQFTEKLALPKLSCPRHDFCTYT